MDISKPFANEHAARIKPPNFIRYRRQNDKGGPGVDFVFGIKRDGKSELQAIRFDSKKFTANQAKKWLKDHNHKTILFEPAKKPVKKDFKSETDKGLAFEWRVACAKYGTLSRGGDTGFESSEDFVEFAKGIHAEMKMRGMTINLLKLSKEGRELYDQIIDKVKKLIGRTTEDDGHAHGFTIDDKGNGKTSRNDGHLHEIKDSKVQEADGHSHKLVIKQEKKKRDFEELRKADKDFVIEFSEVLKRMNGSVLEIGCGAGKALVLLKNANTSVTGIDIDKECIDELEKIECKAYKMDATDLAFTNNSFDTVFSMHTLNTIKDIRKAISESVRVAKALAIHIVPIGRVEDSSKHEFNKFDDLREFMHLIPFSKSFTRLNTGSAMIVIDKEITASEPIFDNLDDFIVTPDFLSYVGGVVNKSNYNDIDFVYKARPDASVELPFRNQFDKDTQTKLHPIANEKGPHGSHIPLYDLVARRKKQFNFVPIGKSAFKSNTPFLPPEIGERAFDIKKFMDNWAAPLLETGTPLAIEKKYIGWRTVHQFNGEESLICRRDGKDLSKQFPCIVEDLKKAGSVVFDSVISAVSDDNERLITKDTELDEKQVLDRVFTKDGKRGTLEVNVTDVIFYKGSDLRNKPWSERREILEKIFDKAEFGVLKMSDSKTASDRFDIISEINRVSNEPGSSGAVAKSAKSIYSFDICHDWASVVNQFEMRTVVKSVETKDGLHTYEVGYALDTKKSREGDNIRVLGKTDATKLEAKEGDILTILTKSVEPVKVDDKWGVNADGISVFKIDTAKKPDAAKDIIRQGADRGLLKVDDSLKKKLTDLKIIKDETNIDIKEGAEGEVVLFGHKDDSTIIVKDNKNINIVSKFENNSEWITLGDTRPVSIKMDKIKENKSIKKINKVKFKAGVQDKHFKEFWFDSELLKGRWTMSLVKDGKRQWMLSRPKDQKMKSSLFDEKEKSIDKTFPLIKDAEKQIVYGVVYEPFDGKNIDTDGDYATKEEVEKACHKFMEDYNSISLMHTKRIDNRAKVVECYIAPSDLRIGGQLIKKGSWVMGTHIIDKKLWKAIKDGKINAYSIEGKAIAGPSLL